ncbi:MAG: cysteine-rich CWC family protein [Burkholderiaceae bacterium]
MPTTPSVPPAPDPARCPLCGQHNQCAMQKKGPDESGPCWCVSTRFTPALLARLPPAALGKACICPRCARANPRY